jgi:hypothetical protein
VSAATGGWDYVAGGYGATVALLGGYVLYLRRRARVLARYLPTPAPEEPPAPPDPPATQEPG